MTEQFRPFLSPNRSGENAALAAFKEFKRNNFEREDYQKGS
jgi:hypothetical protein